MNFEFQECLFPMPLLNIITVDALQVHFSNLSVLAISVRASRRLVTVEISVT